jgi:hypothetical protein
MFEVILDASSIHVNLIASNVISFSVYTQVSLFFQYKNISIPCEFILHHPVYALGFDYQA